MTYPNNNKLHINNDPDVTLALDHAQHELADYIQRTEGIRTAVKRMGEKCAFAERCAKCDHACDSVKTMTRLATK